MTNPDEPEGGRKRPKTPYVGLLVWRCDRLLIEKIGEVKVNRETGEDESFVSREYLLPYLVRLGRVYLPAAANGERILVLEYDGIGKIKRIAPFRYAHACPPEEEWVPDELLVPQSVSEGFLELAGLHGYPSTPHLVNFLLGVGIRVLSFRRLYADVVLFGRNGSQIRLDLL